MTISKITAFIKTVATWGDSDFDKNVHENFSSLKEMGPQINATAADIQAAGESIELIQNNINSTKEDIDTKKEQIDTKHSEVMGHAIPTEATYNTQTINKKVKMSQILNLTGA